MVENPNAPFQHNKNEQESDVEMEEELANDEEEEEEEEYPESEEFKAIDNQLDMLNSVLDNMEQRSDAIFTELTSLLNANKEVRQQLQQYNVEEQPNVETSK